MPSVWENDQDRFNSDKSKDISSDDPSTLWSVKNKRRSSNFGFDGCKWKNPKWATLFWWIEGSNINQEEDEAQHHMLRRRLISYFTQGTNVAICTRIRNSLASSV